VPSQQSNAQLQKQHNLNAGIYIIAQIYVIIDTTAHVGQMSQCHMSYESTERKQENGD
jgi:hypothetical protein